MSAQQGAHCMFWNDAHHCARSLKQPTTLVLQQSPRQNLDDTASNHPMPEDVEVELHEHPADQRVVLREPGYSQLLVSEGCTPLGWWHCNLIPGRHKCGKRSQERYFGILPHRTLQRCISVIVAFEGRGCCAMDCYCVPLPHACAALPLLPPVHAGAYTAATGGVRVESGASDTTIAAADWVQINFIRSSRTYHTFGIPRWR